MKISIITPSYNSELFIRTTLVSIHNQSHLDYEHILIDGNSSDSTVAIAREFNSIVVTEQDKGQSDAINKGLKMAVGDIIAWQNADDLYFKETLKVVSDYFSTHPEVDVVYGDYQLIDHDGKLICDVHPISWHTWMFAHGRFCPLQPTVFWRKRVTDKIGFLNENLHYCMDVDYFCRMIKNGFVFKRIPHMLGQFRVHNQSKTQNSLNDAKVFQEHRDVLANHFDYNLFDHIFFVLFYYRGRLGRLVKQKMFGNG